MYAQQAWEILSCLIKTALSQGPEGICLYQKAVYNKESLPVAGASLFYYQSSNCGVSPSAPDCSRL